MGAFSYNGLEAKTITVQGFNSKLLDDKVNSFLHNKDIEVYDIQYSTNYAGATSVSIGSYKFVYTAFILYKVRRD